jgi:hypothetical protein
MLTNAGLPPRSMLEAATRRKLFFDSSGNPRIVPNSRGILSLPPSLCRARARARALSLSLSRARARSLSLSLSLSLTHTHTRTHTHISMLTYADVSREAAAAGVEGPSWRAAVHRQAAPELPPSLPRVG